MATWIALAVVFLCISQTTSTGLKPPATKPVRKFVARSRLPPSYADASLAQRLYSDESAAAGACTALILAALTVGLAVPELRNNSAWAVTIVAAFLLGRAAGAIIPVVRATVSHRGDAPRIARPFAPTVDDYVPALARWGAAAAGLLPIAALGLLLVFLGTGHVDADEANWPLLALSAVLGPAIAAGTAFLAARFVAAPRPAVAPHELAADDAVRAYRLRALFTASAGVCALAAATIAGSATSMTTGDMVIQNPAAVLQMGAAFLSGAAYIVAAIAIDLVGTGRRYRDRLWPQGFPAGPAYPYGGTAGDGSTGGGPDSGPGDGGSAGGGRWNGGTR